MENMLLFLEYYSTRYMIIILIVFHKIQKHECCLNMDDDAIHSSEQIHNKREQMLLKTIHPVHNITGFGLSKTETKQLFFL